jgi:hypothetical protein
MRLPSLLLASCLAAFPVAPASPAPGDPRDVLRNCEALLDRAARTTPGADKPTEADIIRCRQVVHDWTMRDSRMLVDEHGRKLQ